MNKEKLRTLSIEDLQKQVNILKKDIQLLKLKSDTSNISKIRAFKKDVSRHLTEINERGNL